MKFFHVDYFEYDKFPLDLWKDVLAKESKVHLFQTPLWAKLRKKLWNVDPVLLVFYEKKCPIGYLLFFKEAFKNQFLAQNPPLNKIIPVIKKIYPIVSWNFGPVFISRELEKRYFKNVLEYLTDFYKKAGIKEIVQASPPLFFSSNPDEYKNYFLDNGFSLATRATLYIDLTSPHETLWKKFKHSVKKNISRCSREKVEVRTLNSNNEYREFYDTYSIFRKKRGLRTFPYKDLLSHVDILKSSGCFEIFAAFHNKRMIATLAVNIYNGIVTEVLGANTAYSIEKKLNPNDLLKWKIIQWSQSKGYSLFDLSGVHPNPIPGSVDEGIRKFKSKFGGTLTPYYIYSKKL